MKGPLVGTAVFMAAACRYRIASSDFRMLLPRAPGMIAGSSDMDRLVRIMPPTRADQMMVFDESFDAKEAYRMNFVNWVVEPDKLREETERRVGKIVEGPSIAIRQVRATIQHVLNNPGLRGLENHYEPVGGDNVFETIEWDRAHKDHRPPQYIS